MSLIYEVISIALVFAAGKLLAVVIPVPASLLSMVLFFVLLYTRVLKVEKYQQLSMFLLKNLSFFFIPSAVKILDTLDVLQGNWGKLILIMVVSNFLVMGVTGAVLQFFLKKSGRKHG